MQPSECILVNATMMDMIDNMVEDLGTEEDREMIKMDTSRLFIEILESEDRGEVEVCDGQFLKQKHECDNTSMELTDDGELECLDDYVIDEASMGDVESEASMGGGGVNTLTGSKSNIVIDEASLGEVESEASMGGEGVNAPTGSKSNNVRSKPGYCKMSSKAQADKKKQKSIQEIETLAVLFVDQTKGGALQKTIQAAEDSIALMVGYRVIK